MRSTMLCRLGLISLVAAFLLARDAPRAHGSPTAGPSTAPSTNPTTGPATAPSAADAGPSKPSKNRAWVSGTVLTPEGKPAAGVVIRVEKNEPMGMGGGGPPKDTGPKEYLATTDENGNFLIKEMYINAYLLIGGNQQIGWLYQELPVEAGKETKLGPMKLTKLD